MDCIGVRELRLWAHVGVLDHERRDGQWFSVDFSVQLDLKASAVADDLSGSLDYSVAIQALQDLSQHVRCLTIEHFSEQMLDRLDNLYGSMPTWLRLTKCAAPVPGFNGRVFVERSRHGGRSAL
ncbi:dihydroneopterin aldolase [Synechococcus sp. KORDI-52]|uniref:dihydroneopterin aldolase n=1 Tax=Synechococcus sp. KORDI-52 TaxID=585425 RepID=UPI0004E03E20|nr:dihydroneopterin aldolase [Synechococcus sp. KORDI-52]AII49835.1 dihydroneopterin aldolase [Synechococcus sp. KORDI-52]